MATILRPTRTAPAPATTEPSPWISRREEVATAVFVLWCVSGLFLDGWSHNVAKPESFFTPWHGLLYSGFGAAVGWSMYEANRARLAGEPESAAATDRLNKVGLALFATGMVGDFLWHTVFGIEQDIEGLLSPTHLALMIGGMILASMPLRLGTLARADGDRSFRAVLPGLVSLTAIAGIALFFLQFVSAFVGRNVALAVAAQGYDDAAEGAAIIGVTSVVVTGSVLAGVALVLRRRGPLPFGSYTAVTGVLALAMSGLHGFTLPLLVVAAAAGGLAADVVAHRGHPEHVAVAQAVVLWPLWFAAVAVSTPLRWSAELVGGSIAITVLAAVGLTILAHPEREGSPLRS